MKIKLFEKNSPVRNSSIYLGYLILKKMSASRGKKELSMFQVTRMIKDLNPTCNAKQIIFALMFLHAADLIEFQKPFVRLKYVETN